jgi:hypothetical protein
MRNPTELEIQEASKLLYEKQLSETNRNILVLQRLRDYKSPQSAQISPVDGTIALGDKKIAQLKEEEIAEIIDADTTATIADQLFKQYLTNLQKICDVMQNAQLDFSQKCWIDRETRSHVVIPDTHALTAGNA